MTVLLSGIRIVAYYELFNTSEGSSTTRPCNKELSGSVDPFEGRCCGPTCDGCWLSAVSVYSTFANVFPLLPDTRPNAALRVLHIGPAFVLLVYSLQCVPMKCSVLWIV